MRCCAGKPDAHRVAILVQLGVVCWRGYRILDGGTWHRCWNQVADHQSRDRCIAIWKGVGVGTTRFDFFRWRVAHSRCRRVREIQAIETGHSDSPAIKRRNGIDPATPIRVCVM